jgi:hypothetical protein
MDTIDLTLRKGVTVRLPRAQIKELANATPAEVSKIEIQPGGDGISFLKINVDIYVPGLLADELGPLLSKVSGRRSLGRTSEKNSHSRRRRFGEPQNEGNTDPA